MNPSLFKNNNAQPTMASDVALNHIFVGRFLCISHSMIPENIGALPIVTTVPMAIPVRRMEVKKQYWKIAMANADKISSFPWPIPKIDFPKSKQIRAK